MVLTTSYHNIVFQLSYVPQNPDQCLHMYAKFIVCGIAILSRFHYLEFGVENSDPSVRFIETYSRDGRRMFYQSIFQLYP